MGDLSKHFNRSEFACSCGCGFDTVDAELLDALEGCIEYIRNRFRASSRVSMHIHSGCRCKTYNEDVQLQANKNYVPGTSNSTHMLGQAADFHMKIHYEGITPKTIPVRTITDYLQSEYPKQFGVGLYSSWVHFDVKSGTARRWGF